MENNLKKFYLLNLFLLLLPPQISSALELPNLFNPLPNLPSWFGPRPYTKFDESKLLGGNFHPSVDLNMPGRAVVKPIVAGRITDIKFSPYDKYDTHGLHILVTDTQNHIWRYSHLLKIGTAPIYLRRNWIKCAAITA